MVLARLCASKSSLTLRSDPRYSADGPEVLLDSLDEGKLSAPSQPIPAPLLYLTSKRKSITMGGVQCVVLVNVVVTFLPIPCPFFASQAQVPLVVFLKLPSFDHNPSMSFPSNVKRRIKEKEKENKGQQS